MTSRGDWVAASLACCALVTAIALLPPDVFWITDEGTKFIQLQSLARFARIDIVYTGPPALLPDAGFHLVRLNGRVYSLFLPYFAFLNLIPFRLFGIYGVYLLPALGALISMLVTMKMGGRAAGLTLLFATPVFFYGITYWEHTAALALSTVAVVLLLPRHPEPGDSAQGTLGEGPHGAGGAPPNHPGPSLTLGMTAGALLAASTLLREEGYLFATAIVIALAIRDRSLKSAAVVAGAFALAMSPAWLWHMRLYGSPLGLHAAVYSAYARGSFAFFDSLIRFRPQTWVSIALVVPQLAAPFTPRRWWRVVMALACLTGLAAAVLLATDVERIMATSDATGLLPSLPFVTLALLAWREGDRFLQTICILFIIGACLTLSSAGTWIIWGPRHFFPILPLLVVLSVEGWRQMERPRLAAVLLLAAVLIQANGIYDLALKKRGTERIRAAIVAEGASVVITDVFWLPQEMASLFYEKTFLLAKTDTAAEGAIAALRARGVERITFVGGRHYRLLSNRSLQPMMLTATRRRRVVTPGMDFMDVMVISCDLGKTR